MCVGSSKAGTHAANTSSSSSASASSVGNADRAAADDAVRVKNSQSECDDVERQMDEKFYLKKNRKIGENQMLKQMKNKRPEMKKIFTNLFHSNRRQPILQLLPHLF